VGGLEEGVTPRSFAPIFWKKVKVSEQRTSKALPVYRNILARVFHPAGMSLIIIGQILSSKKVGTLPSLGEVVEW